MQKELSVPRGRSNSISYKPYTSMLPLKDIKNILSSFETLEEFQYTGWSLTTLGMAFYNPYILSIFGGSINTASRLVLAIMDDCRALKDE